MAIPRSEKPKRLFLRAFFCTRTPRITQILTDKAIKKSAFGARHPYGRQSPAACPEPAEGLGACFVRRPFTPYIYLKYRFEYAVKPNAVISGMTTSATMLTLCIIVTPSMNSSSLGGKLIICTMS